MLQQGSKGCICKKRNVYFSAEMSILKSDCNVHFDVSFQKINVISLS